MKKTSKGLSIVSAFYYDPKIDPGMGTAVTSYLSARVTNGRLLYDGIYNRIFPDRFEGVVKRLQVSIEFEGKKYTKYYNENEKIDLPSDLGMEAKKWWERTWVQALVVLGAISGILALFL